MKNIKRIAAMTVCAALAGSITAGAVSFPKVQMRPIVKISSSVQSGAQLSGPLQKILNRILEQSCVITPPDVQPPSGDTDNTPVIPDLPDNTPEPPDLPDNTPETPDLPDNTPETPDDGAQSSYEAAVVRLVNAERAKAGLSALTVDAKAQAAAQVRAREQAQSFSHTRPNGSSYSTALTEAGASFRASGENIAYGQKTPEAVMNAWMNSSGHRANILSARFSAIGVGYAEVNGQAYWTQLFIG